MGTQLTTRSEAGPNIYPDPEYPSTGPHNSCLEVTPRCGFACCAIGNGGAGGVATVGVSLYIFRRVTSFVFRITSIVRWYLGSGNNTSQNISAISIQNV